MNPLHTLDDLQKTYRLLVETFHQIANDDIRNWIHHRINQGDFLWRQPFLTLQRRFQLAEPLEHYIASGPLYPELKKVFRSKVGITNSPPIHPRKHQAQSWEV